MTLPEQYAHDYRDMAMTEEELQKMLEEFSDEIRKRIETYINFALHAAGVSEGRAKRQAKIAVFCALADMESMRFTK